ncbi:MAG TPA: NfeD family protein [Pseudonocardiaceae bacterium]|jgi:membrane protein implicated in regulation of membrane protease activity|nr:NfeD family protein [Pseudonocardiaceae bacterium]
MAALLWLIIGVILVLAEMLSGAFVLVMLGGAALVAALVASIGAGGILSGLVFAAVAAGGITLARPALVRHMHLGEHVKTNVDALVGGKAVVVATVDAQSGQVKINGEVWSARSYDETEVLEPGRSVTIMNISGATAVVWGGL